MNHSRVRLVQAGSGWFRLVQAGSGWFGLVQSVQCGPLKNIEIYIAAVLHLDRNVCDFSSKRFRGSRSLNWFRSSPAWRLAPKRASKTLKNVDKTSKNVEIVGAGVEKR